MYLYFLTGWCNIIYILLPNCFRTFGVFILSRRVNFVSRFVLKGYTGFHADRWSCLFWQVFMLTVGLVYSLSGRFLYWRWQVCSLWQVSVLSDMFVLYGWFMCWPLTCLFSLAGVCTDHWHVCSLLQVYVMDIGALYLLPLFALIAICYLLLTRGNGKGRLFSLLSLPASPSSKKSVKGLLVTFLVFAVGWCVWTSPIWLNLWESSPRSHPRRTVR